MVKIIVGGCCQGKLEYALKQENAGKDQVFDGAKDEISRIGDYRILNHVHLLIRRLLLEQKDAGKFLSKYVETHPDAMLICDEVGSGIVPLEQEERFWREQVGRIMCMLVKNAGEVERICCGIPQRIK